MLGNENMTLKITLKIENNTENPGIRTKKMSNNEKKNQCDFSVLDNKGKFFNVIINVYSSVKMCVFFFSYMTNTR